jgi:hypothetical protein
MHPFLNLPRSEFTFVTSGILAAPESKEVPVDFISTPCTAGKGSAISCGSLGARMRFWKGARTWTGQDPSGAMFISTAPPRSLAEASRAAATISSLVFGTV